MENRENGLIKNDSWLGGWFDDFFNNGHWAEEMQKLMNGETKDLWKGKQDFKDDLLYDDSWIENEDSYELNFDNVPNNPDKIDVTVEDGIVKVKYSVKTKNFSSSYSYNRTLPEDCNYDEIKAELSEDNKLIVTVPKKKN